MKRLQIKKVGISTACAGPRVIIADNVNNRIKAIVDSWVFFVKNFIFYFSSFLIPKSALIKSCFNMLIIQRTINLVFLLRGGILPNDTDVHFFSKIGLNKSLSRLSLVNLIYQN